MKNYFIKITNKDVLALDGDRIIRQTRPLSLFAYGVRRGSKIEFTNSFSIYDRYLNFINGFFKIVQLK